MENKEEIIKLITTNLHPGYGVDKGWSWYVGGMRDTGAWYLQKLEEIDESELSTFYHTTKQAEEESLRQQRERLDKISKMTEEEKSEFFQREQEEQERLWKELIDLKNNRLMWGNPEKRTNFGK